MSIEKLKEQARRHEQKEEWQKALDQYKQAIEKLAKDDQPDIGLYNRVGDLFVRVGNLGEAVEHYEQAIDLYMEAELPNNAIAVCKKVIRNVPDRYAVYLKMGRIRGSQGFMPDARTNYLTYAERAVQDGAIDESFEALTELADLVPDDVELRLMVGEQLASHERAEEAVVQMTKAYQQLMLTGNTGQAETVEGRIRELDPGADLAAPAAAPAGGDMAFDTGSGISEDGEVEADFGEISFGGEDEAAETVEEAAEEEAGISMEGFAEISHEEGEEEEEAAELPLMGFDSEDDEGAEDDEEAAELPLMGFDSEDDEGAEDDEEAAELPMMDFDSEDDDGAEEEAAELPLMGFDSGDDEGAEDEEEAAELPTMDFDAGDEAEIEEESALDVSAFGEADHGDREDKEYVDGEEEMGEIAVDLDVHLGDEDEEPAEAAEAVAEAQEEAVAEAPEEVAEEEAAPEEPAEAPAEPGGEGDFVDLGSMILGDDRGEKSTRFVVAYEEPSGDEEADFAKMLSQFKEKVSESLDSADVKAHYDLGTAYKEMGLLDEAITEFQQALRASASHLPTYEVMGQTFLEMGNPDAAVRSLKRALEVDFDVEDELVGIYYYLARAYEEKGNKDDAVEFYDRVFALDINFADVTERLRALR